MDASENHMGYSPTAPAKNSLFGLISNVNKGILPKQPKSILKKASSRESTSAVEDAVTTEAEETPGVQKALAVAEKLSYITQFATMQKRNEAFLAAKSTIEQIQFGLWKPQANEEKAIRREALAAEQRSKLYSAGKNATAVKPKQVTDRPGLGYSSSGAQSLLTAQPSARTSSYPVSSAGFSEFKKPLPVVKKTLVDYDDDEHEELNKQTSDLTNEKALKEIDMYRFIPKERKQTNISNSSDRHSFDKFESESDMGDSYDRSEVTRDGGRESYNHESEEYRMPEPQRKFTEKSSRNENGHSPERFNKEKDSGMVRGDSYSRRHSRDYSPLVLDNDYAAETTRLSDNDGRSRNTYRRFEEKSDDDLRKHSLSQLRENTIDDSNRKYDKPAHQTGKTVQLSYGVSHAQERRDNHERRNYSQSPELDVRGTRRDSPETFKERTDHCRRRDSFHEQHQNKDLSKQKDALRYDDHFTKSYHGSEERSKLEGNGRYETTYDVSSTHEDTPQHQVSLNQAYSGKSFYDEDMSSGVNSVLQGSLQSKLESSDRHMLYEDYLFSGAEQNSDTSDARRFKEGTDRPDTYRSGSLAVSESGNATNSTLGYGGIAISTVGYVYMPSLPASYGVVAPSGFGPLTTTSVRYPGIETSSVGPASVVYPPPVFPPPGFAGVQLPNAHPVFGSLTSSNIVGAMPHNFQGPVQSGEDFGGFDQNAISGFQGQVVVAIFECKDCGVAFQDQGMYNSHLQSDTHLLAIQQKAAELFQMSGRQRTRKSRFDSDNSATPIHPVQPMGMIHQTPALPPTPVGPLEIVSVRMTRVRLAWCRQRDVEEGRVDRYVVEYRNARDTQWIKAGDTQDNEFLIDGLREGTDYLFRVYSIYGIGKSEYLESVLVSTMKDRRDSPRRDDLRDRRRTRVSSDRVSRDSSSKDRQYGDRGIDKYVEKHRKIEKDKYKEKDNSKECHKDHSRDKLQSWEQESEKGSKSNSESTESHKDGRNDSLSAGNAVTGKKAEQVEMKNNSKDKIADAVSVDVDMDTDNQDNDMLFGLEEALSKEFCDEDQFIDFMDEEEGEEIEGMEAEDSGMEEIEEERKEDKEEVETVDKKLLEMQRRIREVAEEKVECQLYKEFGDKINDPLIGLEFVTEVISYDPTTAPRYICTICKIKGCTSNMISHLLGYAHKMEYMKQHKPMLYDMLLMIPTRKLRIERLSFEIMHLEDTVGRGGIMVTKLLNPEDHENKHTFSDPVPVLAPKPHREKAVEPKVEKNEELESHFDMLVDEFVERGMGDGILIGLNYILEFLHPEHTELPRYNCKLCDVVCSPGTIVYHVIGKKHRLAYFKAKMPDEHTLLINTKDKTLLQTKVAELAPEHRGKIKTCQAKKDNMWRYDKKGDHTSHQNVGPIREAVVGALPGSGVGTSLKKTTIAGKQSGKGAQKIKFVIKKSEAEPTSLPTTATVLEGKGKSREEFDWTKENAELQTKIQNQTIIKCSRQSKFLTIYSGHFNKCPVIGLQWVTEFQRPDPKMEPWYMCFMCKQKIAWKSILDHVTSNTHRLNYVKKNHPTRYQYLKRVLTEDKSKMGGVLEHVSRQILQEEEDTPAIEVMLELNINTEALKSVMKIKGNVKTSAASSTVSKTSTVSSFGAATQTASMLTDSTSTLSCASTPQGNVTDSSTQESSHSFLVASSVSYPSQLLDSQAYYSHASVSAGVPAFRQGFIPAATSISLATAIPEAAISSYPNNFQVSLESESMQGHVPTAHVFQTQDQSGEGGFPKGIQEVIQHQAQEVLTKQILQMGMFPQSRGEAPLDGCSANIVSEIGLEETLTPAIGIDSDKQSGPVYGSGRDGGSRGSWSRGIEHRKHDIRSHFTAGDKRPHSDRGHDDKDKRYRRRDDENFERDSNVSYGSRDSERDRRHDSSRKRRSESYRSFSRERSQRSESPRSRRNNNFAKRSEKSPNKMVRMKEEERVVKHFDRKSRNYHIEDRGFLDDRHRDVEVYYEDVNKGNLFDPSLRKTDEFGGLHVELHATGHGLNENFEEDGLNRRFDKEGFNRRDLREDESFSRINENRSFRDDKRGRSRHGFERGNLGRDGRRHDREENWNEMDDYRDSERREDEYSNRKSKEMEKESFETDDFQRDENFSKDSNRNKHSRHSDRMRHESRGLSKYGRNERNFKDRDHTFDRKYENRQEGRFAQDTGKFDEHGDFNERHTDREPQHFDNREGDRNTDDNWSFGARNQEFEATFQREKGQGHDDGNSLGRNIDEERWDSTDQLPDPSREEIERLLRKASSVISGGRDSGNQHHGGSAQGSSGRGRRGGRGRPDLGRGVTRGHGSGFRGLSQGSLLGEPPGALGGAFRGQGGANVGW